MEGVWKRPKNQILGLGRGSGKAKSPKSGLEKAKKEKAKKPNLGEKAKKPGGVSKTKFWGEGTWNTPKKQNFGVDKKRNLGLEGVWKRPKSQIWWLKAKKPNLVAWREFGKGKEIGGKEKAK